MKVLTLDVNSDIEQIRRDFPTLNSKTWFSTAGTGPPLTPVWEAVKTNRELMFSGRKARELNTKGEAAKLLHAKERELCVINRVTQGLNMVSSMMKIKRGENIVVTDLGYPSNTFVWLPLREHGVKIKRIENRNGDITTADFENAIDDDTKVICISHIGYTSGLAYDLKAISEIAHDHDAFLVVDAFQSVGAIDLDCHATNVDFLVTGASKWLCCYSLSGIFYIRDDLIGLFEPTYRYYSRATPHWDDAFHSIDNIRDFDKPLVDSAEKFDRGCVSLDANWGLHAALKYINDLGIENIQRRVRHLSGYLIDGLLNIGCKVNTPLEPERRGGVVTYSTGNYELNEKSNEVLNARDVLVHLRYMGGVGGIRASPHYFNTETEIDKLLSIQKDLMS